MSDAIDSTIEALVAAREGGLTRDDVLALVRDVYAAPWSDDHLHAASSRDSITGVPARSLSCKTAALPMLEAV